MQESTSMKIIGLRLCPFVQRVIIAARYLELKHSVEYLEDGQMPDWLLENNPLGKVPVVFVEDMVLFESHVILNYFDQITSASLYPSDALAKAWQQVLMEVASEALVLHWQMCHATKSSTFQTFHEKLLALLNYCEQNLQGKPYFSGKVFAMIDISFAPLLQRMSDVQSHYLPDLWHDFPRLFEWWQALSKLSVVQESIYPRGADIQHQNLIDGDCYIVQYAKSA